MPKMESRISLPNKAINIRFISWFAYVWIEKMFGVMLLGVTMYLLSAQGD